jgi:hypothetical protein
MDKKEIENYLNALNDDLGSKGIKGEICLYGGAVMCLVYDSRPSTKDVDAIFKPTQEIRQAIQSVAKTNGLPADWLNDAVKGFVVSHPSHVFLDLSHLKIFIPEPDYLLAMKALAARVDATDKEDVRFLLKKLNIKSAEQVFAILEKYYPHERIKPATQFFIEELLEK